MFAAEISNLHMMVGSAVFLIVCGLAICLLSAHAGKPFLVTVFWWIGIVIAVIGAILFIIRPLLWIGKQLTDATGVG